MKRTIIKELIPIGIKNKNNRIYTKEALETPMKDFVERLEKNKGSMGEFGYPIGGRFETNLGNVSHTIDKVWFEEESVPELELDLNDENWWDGPDPNEETKCSLWGEITILDTPRGKIVQELNDDDFVVRPRSSGRVNEDGTVSIYTLFTFDIINKSDDTW